MKDYKTTLPLARKIYLATHGKPKDHQQWADGSNKIGDINKILQNEHI